MLKKLISQIMYLRTLCGPAAEQNPLALLNKKVLAQELTLERNVVTSFGNSVNHVYLSYLKDFTHTLINIDCSANF